MVHVATGGKSKEMVRLFDRTPVLSKNRIMFRNWILKFIYVRFAMLCGALVVYLESRYHLCIDKYDYNEAEPKFKMTKLLLIITRKCFVFKLPMVVKIPHSGSEIDVCSTLNYSLLGFGDIVVPGE